MYGYQIYFLLRPRQRKWHQIEFFLNENLTSFWRELLKQANKKRKEGLLVSAWSMDGKIFIKTSPEGLSLSIRVYDKNDL